MSERLSVGLFVYFMQLCGFKKALGQRWCGSGSRGRVQGEDLADADRSAGPWTCRAWLLSLSAGGNLWIANCSQCKSLLLSTSVPSLTSPVPTWPNCPHVSSTCLIVPAPFPQGFELTSPLCQIVLSWVESNVYSLRNFCARPLVCWWFRLGCLDLLDPLTDVWPWTLPGDHILDHPCGSAQIWPKHLSSEHFQSQNP